MAMAFGGALIRVACLLVQAATVVFAGSLVTNASILFRLPGCFGEEAHLNGATVLASNARATETHIGARHLSLPQAGLPEASQESQGGAAMRLAILFAQCHGWSGDESQWCLQTIRKSPSLHTIKRSLAQLGVQTEIAKHISLEDLGRNLPALLHLEDNVHGTGQLALLFGLDTDYVYYIAERNASFSRMDRQTFFRQWSGFLVYATHDPQADRLTAVFVSTVLIVIGLGLARAGFTASIRAVVSSITRARGR